MVPLRLRIAGFLSYRDEREILFDGASLWILTGPNGSGKSSVFDAITYALFGAHRGGQQNAEELIHKDADSLEVEFEFRVQNQRYKISRTLRRSVSGSGRVRIAATRQAYEFDPASPHRWIPIRDTDKDKGFNEWVRNLLGFDYHTFTSSVLLLQGQAEKLLNNDALQRYQVLSHVVDLERYEQLSRRAEDRRRTARAEYEAARQQYEQLTIVGQEDLEEAHRRVQQLQQELDETQRRLETLHHQRAESQRWEDTCARLAEVRSRLQAARELCRNAPTIERDYARWQELCNVLPVVETILTEQGRIHESELRLQQLGSLRQNRVALLKQQQTELRRQEGELNQHRNDLKREQAELDQLKDRLQQLGPQLALCQQWEEAVRQAAEVERHLQQFPADLEEQLRQAAEELERLCRDERDLAHLERLHRLQAELRQLLTERPQLETEDACLQKQGQQVRQELEAARQQLEQTQQEWEGVRRRLAQMQALTAQARQSLDSFRSLQGTPLCQTCGQPLTASHYAAEEQRRLEALARAEAEMHAAAEDEQKVRLRYQQCQQRHRQLDEQLQQLREAWRETQSRLRSNHERLNRLAQECYDAYCRLTPPARERFGTPLREPAEWAAADYPSREELTRLQQQVQHLAAQQQRWQKLNEQLQDKRRFEDQLAQLRQRSDRLRQRLPSGLSSDQLLMEQQRCQSRVSALRQATSVRQATIEKLEVQLRQLAEEVQRLELECVRLDGEITAEKQKQEQSRELMEREQRRLPPQWRQAAEKASLSHRHAWVQEREELEQRDIVSTFQQLQTARQHLDQLERECEQLTAVEQAFAPEVRCAVKTWDACIAEETARQQRLIQQHSQAVSRWDQLQARQAERERLERQVRELEVRYKRWDELCRLLGRKGLQLHLLRHSERQIVDYANQILDRLSGGQLLLRCAQSDDGSVAEKALELECIQRQGSGRPINIKFLSGSQRFRVAVALALAIGQYVSHRHQPIECVIIDEGFGCLDREGRQVMIQELHNLSQCLKCILLVSHQEEFADAFHNGYRFELRQGSTNIERLQR